MWSSYFLAGEPAWGVSCLSNESRSLLPNRKLTNLAVLKTVAVATTAMTVSHLLHVKRTLIDHPQGRGFGLERRQSDSRCHTFNHFSAPHLTALSAVHDMNHRQVTLQGRCCYPYVQTESEA